MRPKINVERIVFLMSLIVIAVTVFQFSALLSDCASAEAEAETIPAVTSKLSIDRAEAEGADGGSDTEDLRARREVILTSLKVLSSTRWVILPPTLNAAIDSLSANGYFKQPSYALSEVPQDSVSNDGLTSTTPATETNADLVPAVSEESDVNVETTLTSEVTEIASAPEVTETDASEPKKIMDVPISAADQQTIFNDVCEGNLEHFVWLMAIARDESGFDPLKVGDNGNALGMWQVQPQWHWDRMERLGITNEDLFDTVKCATVAYDYLKQLMREQGVTTITHAVLICYNAGHLTRGVYTTTYSRIVTSYFKEYWSWFGY